MPSRCAVLIWEAMTILEAELQARVVDVLDSRSAESELGKSSSRSRGDAAGITLSLSTRAETIIPNYRYSLVKIVAIDYLAVKRANDMYRISSEVAV